MSAVARERVGSWGAAYFIHKSKEGIMYFQVI